MTIPQPLLNAAKSHRIIPFIGAGFSRVFNLPSWSQLIDEISGLMGYDPEIANLYGDFLQLAEFLSIENNGLNDLKSQLDRSFNSSTIDISKSDAHLLLTQLHAKTIYTTNWDSLIERSFAHRGIQINKIVTFNDFINADPKRTSVIKFHGDLTSSEQTLIFTESSYYGRLDFESPVDIRLRSDMLGNVLLFVGYSLSDFNLRYMWFKLQKLMAREKLTKRQDPFAYIVMAKPNPIFESICRNSRNIEVISLDPIDTQNSLISLMQELVNQAN
ncbi:MAG: hypothetical protein BGO21_26190 [Dyadobacter sp. 50-39]|uniref:SIR2 family protein n=1 Tax=Dyadobacter sp. 50-39 TaxID=1895756 RepID=UPI000961C882|nr:SIR2 family protein [Dyadobacter sp. 50-39]OJV16391.1 MAG: hypothetical protein BGO21_26190 [Dyadobacter sp. 50-39]